MTTFVNKLQSVATTVMAMVMVTFVCLSCGHQQQAAQKQTEADSLIIAARSVGENERVLALCDSFQQTGDISLFQAAVWRGYAYGNMGKMQLCKKECKQALSKTPKNEKDSLWYYNCVTILVDTYMSPLNKEKVMQLAPPMIEEMKAWAEKKPSDRIYGYLQFLTCCVGFTEIEMGMKEEAERMLQLSISYIDRLQNTDQTPYSISLKAAKFYNIIVAFLNAEAYSKADKLLPRLDSLASEIKAFQDPTAESYVDHVLSTDYFSHAVIDKALNRPQEAARYLALYRNTNYAKTPTGRMNEAQHLLGMKRYAEAADAYAFMDSFYSNTQGPSLDDMLDYGRKFEANYKADRRDTALAVAAYVFENLDSAITKQKNSDAAELATVYETQQKDAEIAQQQISLSSQRLIGTLIALVLLTTFFIIYTWYRRKAEKRLSAAHAQLQQAYDQLEETTTAKERIESELRIARDIQMSMVPGVFSQHEGLDMYAEMNPAKEVGGDLYGYVMQGDRLYFCVGDVSGKGVPASLFMAQSARLFRTLATEGMMPADIAVRMNNELTEGNDKGMFVTMFMGLLHLDTGRLDYCNCGHNAPIIDGQFLKMEYDNQPLGLWEDDPFYGESIDDIRGKQLLIYTDGLNEAENQQKELLGNNRLLELMSDTSRLDSHQVIDMLKSAVEEHRNGAEPNDDLTLMCIRLGVDSHA